MAQYHVDEQEVQNHDLEDKVEPGHIAEDCNEAGDDAGVEGEDVGVLHQRQAELTKVIAEVLLGDTVLAIALDEGGTQALHLWRQALLIGGIATVEEQGHLAPQVPAPLQLAVLLIEFGGTIEFAALLPLEEE